MRRRPKAFLLISIAIIVISALVYWLGIAAPRKVVLFKTKTVESVGTGEVFPLYGVFYKWNGVEQQEPWWIVFKINGEWKIARLKDVITGKSKEESQRSFVRFDSKWVSQNQFSAQPTRYQTMLLLLGFRPLYEDEIVVFSSILDQIRQYEKD